MRAYDPVVAVKPAVQPEVQVSSNQLTDNGMTESPEEREAFERLEREQQINAMAAIARTCATTSSTGIAASLFDAGCRVDSSKIRKPA